MSIAQVNFNRIKRPNFYSQGRPVQAVTNFHKVNVMQSSSVVMYALTVEPELSTNDLSMRTKMIRMNKKKICTALGDCNDIISTGGNLYASGDSLPLCATVSVSFNDGEYKLTFTKNTEVTQSNDMFLNIVIKNALNALNAYQIGQYQFLPSDIIKMDNRVVDLMKGFYLKISRTSEGCALNVDLRHRILQNKTVLDIIGNRTRQHAADVLRDLSNASVLVTVNEGSRSMSYRIRDICWDETPQSKFKLREGREITFADYFKNKYNISIQNLRQPLVLLGHGKVRQVENEVKIPASLCRLTGLNDEITNNFRMMNDIAAITRMLPGPRAQKTEKLIAVFSNDRRARDVLESWGVEIQSQPITVEGRELPGERFNVINEASQVSNVLANRPVTCRNIPNFERVNFPHVLQKGVLGYPTGALSSWCIISLQNDQECGNRLYNALGAVLRKTQSIKMDAPANFVMPSCPGKDYGLRALDVLKNNMKSKPRLVVCVLPRNGGDDAYKSIKKELGRNGIPTQCVKSEKYDNRQADNKVAQVTEKVAHQIIAKTAGTLWSLPLVLGVNPNQTTMSIGIEELKSNGHWLAMTASLDRLQSKYYSNCVGVTGATKSIVQTFVQNAFLKFNENTKCYPHRIIVYRSGISEGMKEVSMNADCLAIKDACDAANTAYYGTIEIVYVFVNTDIQQRFAIPGNGGMKNPRPLTVFDRGLGTDERFNFWIAHQDVTQGTLTPTLYDVAYVKKTTNITPDNIVDFTGQLSMLYQNWPGPIRVPAPVMYARKLANQTSVTGMPLAANSPLGNLLHFL